jgi:hypothetical protein
MRLPKPVTDTTYYKGVILTRIDEQRIELSELFVDHPGRQLLAFGSSLGYGYTRHGAEIRRNITPSDCPCGNELWAFIARSSDRNSRRGDSTAQGEACGHECIFCWPMVI